MRITYFWLVASFLACDWAFAVTGKKAVKSVPLQLQEMVKSVKLNNPFNVIISVDEKDRYKTLVGC